MLAVLCRTYPQVKALVDDLGLIPVDSIEYRSLDSSFFHDGDLFEADRLLFYHGYVSPSITVRSHDAIRSVSDFREYREALSKAFDMTDDSDWYFTGSLFGHVS